MSINDKRADQGLKSTILGIVINLLLGLIKGFAGFFGNSYALIADAAESFSDILTSLIILIGLKLSRKPADETHPYGHGKFEPLAGFFVACLILIAAFFIGHQSIQQINQPHELPKSYTLIVLLIAIFTKEILFRFVNKVSSEVKSTAVKVDAWHHRSDSITSAAAFIGISLALLGGQGYENLDDYAALVAALVISINALLVLKPSLMELLDTAPDPEIIKNVRDVACQVKGVMGTHKCYVRKLGFDYYLDLDVLCDPNLTLREGHEIAHDVGDAIHKHLPYITKVLVHVEPVDDYGRRSRDSLGEN